MLDPYKKNLNKKICIFEMILACRNPLEIHEIFKNQEKKGKR